MLIVLNNRAQIVNFVIAFKYKHITFIFYARLCSQDKCLNVYHPVKEHRQTVQIQVRCHKLWHLIRIYHCVFEIYNTFLVASTKVQIYVVTLTVIGMDVGFNVTFSSFMSKLFYVSGKALSGELSCTQTGLVMKMIKNR